MSDSSSPLRQDGPESDLDTKRKPWLAYIEQSLDGDILATRNLVQLVLLGAHQEWLNEDFIANGLSQILFSTTVSPDQKRLIWSLKDTIVYVGLPAEIKPETGNPQENKRYAFTFFSYLKSFRSTELKDYTAQYHS